MQYLGGKSRIAKDIVRIMSAERAPNMPWVEPFMGSAKVISLVRGRRIGSDVNLEMIDLFKALRDGWEPPSEVTKDFYNEVKSNQHKYPNHLKAFLSIGCSFGGIRWDCYAKNSRGTNYAKDAKRSLIKLEPKIRDVELYSTDYKLLDIPDHSLIYCDPPYANTAGYGFEFNHEEFYSWCRDKVAEGHYLFVSEYDMPDDFELIWEKEVSVSLSLTSKGLRKKERLYRLHKKPAFSLSMY